jgi:hypothetical protein
MMRKADAKMNVNNGVEKKSSNSRKTENPREVRVDG